MTWRRVLVVLGLLFLPSCLYQVRERTDQVVCDLAAHPYDAQPAQAPTPSPASPPGKPAAAAPAVDVQTSALMESGIGPRHEELPEMQPVALLQDEQGRDEVREAIRKRLEKLKVPQEVPGSEVVPIAWPKEKDAQLATIPKLYPPLPPLPEELKAMPGPNGHPYTLADLQQLAAANSPLLRQAASDVEAARGNLIQAAAYPNPTVTLLNAQASNDGSTPGVWGMGVDQVVKMFGKLKLSRAAAEMDLRNAELALRRARSDLSTAVRNAYFAVLVAQETERVTRALARLTDEVYLAQADVLKGGLNAPYEPATLRAQSWTVRLALRQAIAARIYAWKELIATLGLRQLPLSQVAGRIDRAIPKYDFDAVLAHVLTNHTDVLTARNAVGKAQYLVKLAQITPYPDVEFNVQVLKEYAVAPQQFTPTVTASVPFPLWDHNQGNIRAAEAALVRASDEPHRVEDALTNSLSTAYQSYQSNLEALEYYRRYILPDLVRTYRGVNLRRQVDPSVGFVDLVTAQQALTTGVTTYLGILGSLWTSVVSVADLLQTDDLFQVAEPRELPPLPDLDSLPSWPCQHPCSPLAQDHAAAGPCGGGAPQCGSATNSSENGSKGVQPVPSAGAAAAQAVSPARPVEPASTLEPAPLLTPRQSFRAYWPRREAAPSSLPDQYVEPPPPPPVPHAAPPGQALP